MEKVNAKSTKKVSTKSAVEKKPVSSVKSSTPKEKSAVKKDEKVASNSSKSANKVDIKSTQTPKKVLIDKSKFAIIEINNQQEKVSVGEEIVVDRMNGPKESVSKVLLYTDGSKTTFGKPYLTGAIVNVKKINDFKDKKIEVRTFKAKSRYRKVKGHRQAKSRVLVESISIK